MGLTIGEKYQFVNDMEVEATELFDCEAEEKEKVVALTINGQTFTLGKSEIVELRNNKFIDQLQNIIDVVFGKEIN